MCQPVSSDLGSFLSAMNATCHPFADNQTAPCYGRGICSEKQTCVCDVYYDPDTLCQETVYHTAGMIWALLPVIAGLLYTTGFIFFFLEFITDLRRGGKKARVSNPSLLCKAAIAAYLALSAIWHVVQLYDIVTECKPHVAVLGILGYVGLSLLCAIINLLSIEWFSLMDKARTLDMERATMAVPRKVAIVVLFIAAPILVGLAIMRMFIPLESTILITIGPMTAAVYLTGISIFSGFHAIRLMRFFRSLDIAPRSQELIAKHRTVRLLIILCIVAATSLFNVSMALVSKRSNYIVLIQGVVSASASLVIVWNLHMFLQNYMYTRDKRMCIYFHVMKNPDSATQSSRKLPVSGDTTVSV